AVFYRKGLGTIARYLLAKGHGKLDAALSPRERVIVQLIAEGHSNREMTECHPPQAGGALEAFRLRYLVCVGHTLIPAPAIRHGSAHHLAAPPDCKIEQMKSHN